MIIHDPFTNFSLCRVVNWPVADRRHFVWVVPLMQTKSIGAVALLSGALMLVGCGTSQIKAWSRPGASEEQKQRDLAECDYDASKATIGDGKAPRSTDDAVGEGVVRGMEKSDLIKKCMRIRGYGG